MGSEFTRQRAPAAKDPSSGAIQRQPSPLVVNQPGDRFEQEADRVADAVVNGRGQAATFSLSAMPIARVQREDAPKEKMDEEKYKEAGDKLKDGFLATPLGKDLQEKVKQDRLVKGATEAGRSFIATLPGKIITGAAAAGAVATLAAMHEELPAQIPEIPLDVLTPGLSVEITYKGPVDKPTEAMITFKFAEQAPTGGGDGERKSALTRAEKQRAENAVVAADQAKFRAGMKYPPGSPEDLQQKADEEAAKHALARYAPGPDLDAMVKKYPWLQAPQPKSGLQLEMPKPSLGYKPPALLGNEYKLKLPGEKKKVEDEPGLQRKLAIGASNDPLEQEADWAADQVLAAPAHSLVPIRKTSRGGSHAAGHGRGSPFCSYSDRLLVGGSAPHIQRHAGQATEGTDTAPASVDRVLASPGRPLDPALQQDMEQRFGHDFSRVRVHSGGSAEQSAREVNAHAYTVGHNIVFGGGRYAPGTQEGRRLIAHELVHVIQQAPPSAHPPSSSRNRTPGATADAIAPGIRHISSQMLQRDADTKPEDPWDKLSPSGRKKAQELYDECAAWRAHIGDAQQAHMSTLRRAWYKMLGGNILRRIGELDSDSKIQGMANVLTDYTSGILRNVARFRDEWESVEAHYSDERRYLLSVKSADSTEAVRIIDERYKEAKSWLDRGALDFITDEDYLELKETLDKDKHIWLGALRASRIRAKQLRHMMGVAADLRRSGEDSFKYMPDWSYRVAEEVRHLDSMAKRANEGSLSFYPVEFSRLRDELRENLQRTLEAHPREKSVAEKTADFVTGGTEALVGPFVEAAKEAVDLVQISLHFATLGKYEPKFKSDMAKAAEQGKTTGELLKGMVTGLIETPSRFLKAVEDGDWEAIGREAANLYLLAKTIKEAPEMVKKLPEMVGKTRRALRILQARKVALEIPNEARLLPKPHTPSGTGAPSSSSETRAHEVAEPGTAAGVEKQPPPSRSTNGKIPEAARRGPDQISQLDARIAEAEAELNLAGQKTLDYQASRAAEGKSLKGGPIKGIWNIKERIWVLRRQKAFPGRTILEQPEIVGVKAPNGSVKPTSVIAGKGRTPDFVEIRDTRTVAGDLKSAGEIKESVAGGVKKPGPVEAKFRDSSKIGQQHQAEAKILKEAQEQKGKIVIRGKNVLTGKMETIEVDPVNYSSQVIAYEDVLPN